jgi:DNA-binding IclR family transcriptional regulator
LFPLPSGATLENRVRAEFREMPGMRLSFDQAVRLWALDRRSCQAVLERLIAVGFLQRDDQGRYCKTHGGYQN